MGRQEQWITGIDSLLSTLHFAKLVTIAAQTPTYTNYLQIA